MLTVSEDAEDLATALRASACGYLIEYRRRLPGARAVTALLAKSSIAETMTGKLVAQLGRARGAKPVSELDKLTPREIIDCLSRGEIN
jgi:two-component system nitrate/nitrite response regulator NarL